MSDNPNSGNNNATLAFIVGGLVVAVAVLFFVFSGGEDAPQTETEQAAQAIGEAAQDTADAVGDAARDTADAVGDAAQDAADSATNN